MTRSCDEDPAFDYLLVYLLEAGEPLTVLPTHRLVRIGATSGVGEDVLARARELFDVEEVSRGRLLASFEAPAEGGHGRIGLYVGGGAGGGRAAMLTARRDQFRPYLPPGGAAVQGLDVSLLGVALERVVGVGAEAVTAGATGFTKSAHEALDAVDRGDEFRAAFLLDATPVDDILSVAADGDVMPQKSTYFYPKALTGLVINPHEW